MPTSIVATNSPPIAFSLKFFFPRSALLALLILLTSHNLRADELVPPPNKITPIHSPDGVTFQAYEWGNPSGRPIVFIHGIYQSALSWIKQIGDTALAAKYRLIAIDLRGHGASDKPDGPDFYRDGKRWADDMTALLDALNLRKPVMVAWSYGGRVLNDYLGANGDERLGGIVYVAVRSTAVQTDELPDAISGRRRAEANRDANSPDPLIFIRGTREFVELCFGKPPTEQEIALLTAASMQTPLYVRRQLAGRPVTYDEVLRKIRVPTLIVQGDKDAVVAPSIARITAKLVPHATLSIYHGIGHSIFFEEPARFNAELAAFVGHLP
jgi:non-heme chloroperoxidase